MGFGASTNTRGGFGNLPQSTQEALGNALWKEADFRVLRLWTGSGSSGDGLANNFGKYIQEAKKAQPNLILFLAPTGWIQDLSSSAGAYAQQIKDLRDRHGIEVNVTGISNCSGAGGDVHGYYLDATTFDVTIFLEEMEGSGELEFEVYKSNEDMRIQSKGSATMRDGEMSVTLAPFDLVTLISAPGIASPKLAAKDVPTAVSRQSQAAQGWLYDVRGRRVMKTSAAHCPSVRAAEWMSAKGVYVYRAVEAGAAGMRACLPIR